MRLRRRVRKDSHSAPHPPAPPGLASRAVAAAGGRGARFPASDASPLPPRAPPPPPLLRVHRVLPSAGSGPALRRAQGPTVDPPLAPAPAARRAGRGASRPCRAGRSAGSDSVPRGCAEASGMPREASRPCREVFGVCREVSRLCREASRTCREASRVGRKAFGMPREPSRLCREASRIGRKVSRLCRKVFGAGREASRGCRECFAAPAGPSPVPVLGHSAAARPVDTASGKMSRTTRLHRATCAASELSMSTSTQSAGNPDSKNWSSGGSRSAR